MIKSVWQLTKGKERRKTRNKKEKEKKEKGASSLAFWISWQLRSIWRETYRRMAGNLSGDGGGSVRGQQGICQGTAGDLLRNGGGSIGEWRRICVESNDGSGGDLNKVATNHGFDSHAEQQSCLHLQVRFLLRATQSRLNITYAEQRSCGFNSHPERQSRVSLQVCFKLSNEVATNHGFDSHPEQQSCVICKFDSHPKRRSRVSNTTCAEQLSCGFNSHPERRSRVLLC